MGDPTSAVRVGTLADARMLTGPLDGRRALLARARSAGLDHVFVADHVSFHTGFGMDGIVQAATAAALEPELGVQIGVYLLALRHPVPVARALATLCESAPGRIVLGVGVGGEDRHEIEICGVDPRTRGRRTDECLEVVRGLLRGEPLSFHGEFFDFDDAVIRPAPEPPLPVLVGGRADAALRRAGRLGDGWLGVWSSARRYAQAVREVEEVGAGRDVRWRHGIQVWVGLDADRTRARERLAARMQEVYRIPFDPFEKYCPYGTADAVADFLAPYAEAGCGSFNVMAVADSSEGAIDGVAELAEQLRARTGGRTAS